MIEKTECVFSFWVRMPYSTQVHILYMAASCQTVDPIVVFRNHEWGTPEIGVLSSSSSFLMACLTVCVCTLKHLNNGWRLAKDFKTTMHGSGERKNGLDIPGLLKGLDTINCYMTHFNLCTAASYLVYAFLLL